MLGIVKQGRVACIHINVREFTKLRIEISLPSKITDASVTTTNSKQTYCNIKQ